MDNIVDTELSVYDVPVSEFQNIGVKGYCAFVSQLPYVCPNNLFVLPVAHLLLYGVIRDVNHHIFNKPISKHRCVLTRQ